MTHADDGTAALVSASDDGTRGTSLPLLVALHARGGDARTELDRVRHIFGPAPDVIALQAARPCNPMQSNLRSVAEYAGFSWYLGDDPSRPEAASFGDALAQIDLCVSDFIRPFLRPFLRPFVLVGDEQGAVLAATLALFTPEGLVGVHAARLSSPSIDGWTPPLVRMDGISFVLPDAVDTSPLKRLLLERGAAFAIRNLRDAGELERWLECRPVADAMHA